MPTPDATYRLQLRPEFDFHAAAALTDYLAHLGVSHLYASPYLQAAPGSAHGYDVVDPTRVNEELGGEEGHGALAAALGRAGLGQVLDIVPNHMAITGPENRWWWDVLRNGPASRYATYFDVDWDPPEPRLRNQVLIPVLGDHYGREVESGAIRVEYDDRFVVRYHDHVLPLAPRSLGPLLQAAGHSVVDAEDRMELELLGRVLEELPEPGIPDAAARQRRQRDLVAVDHRIRRLVEQSSAIRVAIDGTLAAVNEDADRLDALLRAQNYRLAYWRVAGQELDYRRFFDIDTLAALRTGDPEVFEAVHRRVLEWLEKGVLDGVRVDHPDGLRRPGEYFRRLRGAAPEAWIVAEKILMPEEPLPPWPVDGTTGYDLLNELTGVCVDPMGEGPLTELWTEVSGDGRPFEEVVYEARQHVLREVLGADVNRLAGVFMDVCETWRRYRDFTRRELRDALVEVAACFPVYRTYVGEMGAAGGGTGEAGARDRAVIARALERARERAPGLDPDLLDFLRAILVAELDSAEARELRMRFQQLTGPVAAKGEEDTAFYRYHRLVALNEVGGDPGRWGVSPERFHARMRERAAEHPTTMNALSTHDTKRSEDVRARLVLLSEIPGAWADAVRRWRTRNAPYWAGDVAPDPATEYLLYQTMVGAWPIDEGRLAAYLEKATREGKQRTSWTDPDPAYDAALEAFVAQLYGSGFDEEVAAFVEPLVGAGRVIALAQKLVQLMAPGVPDIYQGTELWDLSLVDPDNRRAVDFDVRRGILTELDAGPSPERILEGMDRGWPKLWVVRQALRVRRDRRESLRGDYVALDTTGHAASHVLGFLRGGDVAVVVPRLPIRLARDGGWRDTTVALPEGRWSNVLTGERVNAGAAGSRAEAASLLGRFPVALLVREDG